MMIFAAVGRSVPASTEPGPWWVPFVILGMAAWIMIQFTRANRLKWQTRAAAAAPLFVHIGKDIQVTWTSVRWEFLKTYAAFRKRASLRRVKDEVRRIDDEWKKLTGGEETN